MSSTGREAVRRTWSGVVPQQEGRNTFWKDLGRSCDAAGVEKQLLKGFGEQL